MPTKDATYPSSGLLGFGSDVPVFPPIVYPATKAFFPVPISTSDCIIDLIFSEVSLETICLIAVGATVVISPVSVFVIDFTIRGCIKTPSLTSDEIDDTICNYFVICQGNSPSQVSVIADSIWDTIHETIGYKPSAIDGIRNAQWVAMDYSDVLVHIFLPEIREFYNLENLWADAKLTFIPDID
jgi:ribosome-associated protein